MALGYFDLQEGFFLRLAYALEVLRLAYALEVFVAGPCIAISGYKLLV